MGFQIVSSASRTATRAGAVIGALLLATLSGCASGSGSTDLGYVVGSGVLSLVPEGDRTHRPSLDRTALDGKRISLEELRGRPTVINTWYASCPPCIKEGPALSSAWKEFEGAVNFIGINVRDYEEAIAKRFLDEFEIHYPNILNPGGDSLLGFRGVAAPQAVPTTVFLDSDGYVAARVTGEIDLGTIRGILDDLVDESS